MFRKLEEVTPPIALAGMKCRTLSNGKWVDAEITRVELWPHKEGRRKVWGWCYHVSINGVGVVRRDGTIKPIE